mgnify:CR=1 FL=1
MSTSRSPASTLVLCTDDNAKGPDLVVSCSKSLSASVASRVFFNMLSLSPQQKILNIIRSTGAIYGTAPGGIVPRIVKADGK